jgi:hypothetical protein
VLEFTLTVDPDIIVAYAELIDDAPRAVNTFVNETIAGDVRQQVDAINQYPPPAVHPIEWANQIPPPPGKHANIKGGLWSLQKAAYFASDGFGAGIPYVRKGTYWDTYLVAWDEDTGTLLVTSNNPIDQFVTGIYQQPFHANTGWPFVEDEYLKIILLAQDNLIEGYIDIVDIKSLI